MQQVTEIYGRENGWGDPTHHIKASNQETKGVTARNAIYHDSQHPSAIELPIRGK